MRSIFIVLGFIAAVLGLVLAVTPLSQIAYIPAIVALLFGLIAFYISKQNQFPKKSVYLIFLITFISLVLTTYKAVFNTSEAGNLENLELKEEASMEDSKETLEGLELDENEIDSTESDTLEIDVLHNLEELQDQ